NLSREEVDLTGWSLSDMRRDPLNLSDALESGKRVLLPGEAIRIQPVEPVILSNRSGVIALHEPTSENFPKGRRIDRVHYSSQQARREGVPIIFNNRWERSL
ncbi:MAG: endonuclease, partial [Cyanobacteria bacterium J06588_5]